MSLESLKDIATQLGELLMSKKLKLVTAESCTGGGLAYAMTDIPGSSVWFERGFVTYSNAAKQSLLNVPEQILAVHGAVSKEAAVMMAKGALANSLADVAVSVTGIAGPGSDVSGKPVGTVWIAIADKANCIASLLHFDGDRQYVRESTIKVILETLLERFK